MKTLQQHMTETGMKDAELAELVKSESPPGTEEYAAADAVLNAEGGHD